MTHPVYDVFGGRLRAARTRLGLSMEALAARIGEGGSLAVLSRIENGERPVPLHVALAISEALGVTLASMIEPSARWKALGGE